MDDVYLIRRWVDNSCAGVLRSAVVVWSGSVIKFADRYISTLGSRLSALPEAPRYQDRPAPQVVPYLVLYLRSRNSLMPAPALIYAQHVGN